MRVAFKKLWEVIYRAFKWVQKIETDSRRRMAGRVRGRLKKKDKE